MSEPYEDSVIDFVTVVEADDSDYIVSLLRCYDSNLPYLCLSSSLRACMKRRVNSNRA